MTCAFTILRLLGLLHCLTYNADSGGRRYRHADTAVPRRYSVDTAVSLVEAAEGVHASVHI